MIHNQTYEQPSIRYLNIYINLFYLIVGNIANLFKVAFLLQKPLRSLPCTVYILISTFSDFITLNNLPVLQLLIHLYPQYHWIKVTVDWSNQQNQINLLSHSVSVYDVCMCKIRSYLHMLSTNLSFQMLLFASINRYYTSDRRKRRQQRSHLFIRHFCEHPNICRLCLASMMILAFISLQHVFNFTVKSSSEGCIPLYPMVWIVWITSIHFLSPILMIIFGILTLKNIHCVPAYRSCFQSFICNSSRQRQGREHGFTQVCLACTRCENSIQSQIERQITLMIIGEIFVTILSTLPYGLYAFCHLLYTLQQHTLIDSNESAWLPLFIRMTMYFEPCCGFYIYLMALSTLRKRFCKMFHDYILAVFSCIWRH